MATLPLIQDCVLVALDTVGFEVTGGVVIVNCLTDAVTSILVNAASIAYVMDDQGVTYDTSSGGIVEPLAGDRSAWDAAGYSTRHTNDINAGIHWTKAQLDATYGGILLSADPTAQVGPTATNGSAATWMRSDAAPKLADTAVTPGTYGDATNVSQFTVDQQGRLTAAANVAITFPATIVSTYNEVQTGDGTTTIFYLANYALPGTIRVYIDGILQPVTDDTAPSDTVVFTTPPDAGAVITFSYDVEII